MLPIKEQQNTSTDKALTSLMSVECCTGMLCINLKLSSGKLSHYLRTWWACDELRCLLEPNGRGGGGQSFPLLLFEYSKRLCCVSEYLWTPCIISTDLLSNPTCPLLSPLSFFFRAVLGIRIRNRIRIRRIRKFLSLTDPDPLVRGTDPDPDPFLFP
jgi:hypothetical protein